jgi:hypothetical protein
MKNRTKLRLIAQIAMSMLTVFSLAVSTYAWFTTSRTAEASICSMHVAEGMHLSTRFYIGNKNSVDNTYSGYRDIRTRGSPASANVVISYTDDFVLIPDNFFTVSGPLDLSNLTPGVCYTYAFELGVGGDKSIPVALKIDGYTATPSTSNFVYEEGGENGGFTNKGLSLGTAIDIYTSAFTKTDEDTDSANANAFITTYMQNNPVDHFTYVDAATASSSYNAYEGTLEPNSTLVILMTIEFTEQPDTYYAYKGYSSGRQYYYKNPDIGTSNPYRGLSFQIYGISAESV